MKLSGFCPYSLGHVYNMFGRRNVNLAESYPLHTYTYKSKSMDYIHILTGAFVEHVGLRYVALAESHPLSNLRAFPVSCVFLRQDGVQICAFRECITRVVHSGNENSHGKLIKEI